MTTRQFDATLERAKEQGWTPAKAGPTSMRLSHPSAAKPIIVNTADTSKTAIKKLEASMQAAIGPVAGVGLPAAKAAAPAPMPALERSMSPARTPSELRLMLETETYARQHVEQQLAVTAEALRNEQALSGALFQQLRGLQAFQTALKDFMNYTFTALPTSAPSLPSPAPALSYQEPLAAQPAQAAPAVKAARAPRKAAGAATPAKTARASKKAAAAAAASKKPSETPLEKAIAATKKRDLEAATYTAPDGVIITRDNAGSLIAARRVQTEQTLAVVARLFSVSTVTLGNWESGKSRPQFEKFPDIERFLKGASA